MRPMHTVRRPVVVALALVGLLGVAGCSSSVVGPSEDHGPRPPFGAPLVFKGADGRYTQNPLVTLPPGVTIDPVTGAIVYPPTWGQ